MSRNFKICTKPFDEDVKIYNRANITINSGVTILVGCNGIGKSTLIETLKDKLHKEKIPYMSYNNLNDGGHNSLSEVFFHQQYELGSLMFNSSEGENIFINIGRQAGKIHDFIEKNSDKKELWIFFDAIDSGFSIDNIIQVKEQLFDTIIKDCKSKNIEVYIVVSANSYEMANGEQCFDVHSGKYITFNNYDEYKKFILKTNEIKEKRYKTEDK